MKKTYCRVCGPDKGHSFNKCKNLSGIKGIVRLVDAELDSALSEKARLKPFEQTARVAQENANTLYEVVKALLQLVNSTSKSNNAY